MSRCIGEDDLNEARSRLRLLEACDGFEVTFFRDKYPALDGIIHITEPSPALITELSNVLVAFQLKSKSRDRQDHDRSIDLSLSDAEWILSLPIPTVLFVADLKRDDGIFIKWLNEERKERKLRMKPGGQPATEPMRTFTANELFTPVKFRKDAEEFAKQLLEEKLKYVTPVA
jgi:hypothetical protein